MSCREVRTGIRKVMGARARARNGRRGFDRHCADRLVTTDEEDVKKSDAGRRKKTRPGPFLVVQFATPTAPAGQSHAKFIAVSESPIWLVHMRCDGRLGMRTRERAGGFCQG